MMGTVEPFPLAQLNLGVSIISHCGPRKREHRSKSTLFYDRLLSSTVTGTSFYANKLNLTLEEREMVGKHEERS